MIVKIHPENPSEKQIEKVVKCLQNGGVIIYPTDGVYAIGCSIYKPKAIEKVARIKNVKLNKANFSIICHDLSNITEYTTPISNTVFKVLKKSLPGPFTFILEANNLIPKTFKQKRKTIGIRIPNNLIPLEIVRVLESPIISTSVYDEDEILEYTTDPELIYERYEKTVDMVIDGGAGNNVPTTVVDCSTGEIEIVRQGVGELDI